MSTTDTAFEHWWTLPGQWVEPPNDRRRKGWSGVLRAPLADGTVYIKRQLNYLCRTLSHPFGWPTVSREWHYLKRLEELGILAPRPLFHGVRRSADGVEAVLVTEELSGYLSLADLPAVDDSVHAAIARETGLVVGRLHHARLQHCCLYDKHVMVRLDEGRPPRIALIDLEKMHPCLTRARAAARDLRQLQRRQSFFTAADWEIFMTAHQQAIAGR